MDILINIFWYCFIAIVLVFLIFGFDAFFTDVYYLIYVIYRRIKARKYPKLTYEQLAKHPEKKIAIMVACWQESAVIGEMLQRNIRNIDYKNYVIFVGVYVNDPTTVAVVQQAADHNEHVRCVIGENPGPTTKSANLNVIYRYILKESALNHTNFDVIVLHDSEDIIHPLSLKLYNYLIPKKDMVQTPVFPLETNYFNFTHWIYNDEFAENHTKNIIVREAMGGFVPSAGVGTAFSHKAMAALSASNPSHEPFGEDLLTEDYHSSLLISLAGLKSIFESQWIWRRQKKKGLFGGIREILVKEYIATRSHFPAEYMKAVRQKTRWVMGIAIQEWIKSDWPGNLMIRYNLLQDRRSLVTLFFNGFAYVVLICAVIYYFWQQSHLYYPTIGEILDRWPAIYPLIYICTFFMLDRFLQRVIACWCIYGFLPAMLSIPRVFYGNLLNLHAVLRAYKIFLFRPKKRQQPKWEKTEHAFLQKSQGLNPGNKKLGDMLIELGYLTPEKCIIVINEQTQTGRKMGEVLLSHDLINEETLYRVLSKQYNLPLLNEIPVALQRDKLPHISSRKYKWLIASGIIPIKLNNNVLSVGVPDPSDALTIERVSQILKNYRLSFMLYYRKKEET